MVDDAVGAALLAPQVEGAPVDVERVLVAVQRGPTEIAARADVVRVDGECVDCAQARRSGPVPESTLDGVKVGLADNGDDIAVPLERRQPVGHVPLAGPSANHVRRRRGERL